MDRPPAPPHSGFPFTTGPPPLGRESLTETLGRKEEGRDGEREEGQNETIIQADLRPRKRKSSQRILHTEIHGRNM